MPAPSLDTGFRQHDEFCTYRVCESLIRLRLAGPRSNLVPCIFKEALINSSLKYQHKKKAKCDFAFFFIFNILSVIENGGTCLCCGNSELISVSLILYLIFHINNKIALLAFRRSDQHLIVELFLHQCLSHG